MSPLAACPSATAAPMCILDRELRITMAAGGWADLIQGSNVPQRLPDSLLDLLPLRHHAAVRHACTAIWQCRAAQQVLDLPIGADHRAARLTFTPCYARDGTITGVALVIEQRPSLGAGTQLQALLAAVSDGVWICDRHGAIVSYNDAAVAMFGLSRGDVALQRIDDLAQLFNDRGAQDDPFGLREALGGHVVQCDQRLDSRVADWSLRCVHVLAQPIHADDDQIVGAIAIVRDVTQHKAIDQLKNDFMAHAAHELRTPVTAIKGYAQLALMRLRQQSNNEQLQRALHTIDQQAARISHLIGELLDATRLQSGRFELHVHGFDLVALVQRLADQAQRQSPLHQVTVKAPPTLPVTADRTRIEQVIENMLDNAIKYSPDGGPIELVVETRGHEVAVMVRDQGIGISRDKHGQVFQPWFQAHSETCGDYGGLGLGLSICKAIVERHGGRIWFEAMPEGGSSFGFTLPHEQQRAVGA